MSQFIQLPVPSGRPPTPSNILMNQENVKWGVHRTEIGYYIHTALRKYCSSTATSLAWNLIAMPALRDAWGIYLDLVWQALEVPDPDKMPNILRHAAEKLEPRTVELAALLCAFKLFDRNDWISASALLMDEIKEG